jgi:hypothetical protein
MKSKTFWELIFLAIVSFPALHFLGIRIHSINANVDLHSFDVAGIVAAIIFFLIAVLAAIYDKRTHA